MIKKILKSAKINILQTNGSKKLLKESFKKILN
jgi:hypothetical protein